MNVQNFPLSLLTICLLMNATIFNQGNHCILAFCLRPSHLQDVGNMALLVTSEGCFGLRGVVAEALAGKMDAVDYYAMRASFGGGG